jgi:glycosyltransferase involved in cell wall biosynthesis
LSHPVKRAIVAVTNDLVTDQRVKRTCSLLQERGFSVFLVGRELKNSLFMDQRPYPTKRFKLPYNKGALFYASYNLRLFFFLLFRKADLILANDLDTLPACWLAASLKRVKLVYDSHEYYTGVPELEGRPFVKKTWESIERFIFPRLETIITVNDSIAELYNKKYSKTLHVIRNVPFANAHTIDPKDIELTRHKIGLKNGERVLILQGSGINKDRGAEEAVLAMQYLENIKLVLFGGGDSIPELERMVKQHHLSEKVIFMPRMAFRDMMRFTSACDLGLTLDKDTNINYRYSLPNKLFDYIHAGIPVLASRLPEVEKIVAGYDIGTFIRSHDPKTLAQDIEIALSDQDAIARRKKNLQLASQELNWEKESEKFPPL